MIRAAEVTTKKGKTTYFKRRQTTKELTGNIYSGFAERKTVRLMFRRPKGRIKGRC